MTSGTFFSHTKPVRLATHDTAGLHVMTQRLNAIFADLEEVHTDNFDQALKTTDSPSFVGLDIDGAAQIASNLVLGGALFNTQDNSSLIVSGGTAASQGGNVLLYGQSHASFANNIFLRAGAQNVYRWDEQNAQHVWYDQANATDLVLDCNARLRPSTDTELDLGSGSFRWGTVYASGATLTDLTVDTDTLYVDATNNRVGIGTSSPSHDLDVDGDAEITGDLGIGGVPTKSGVHILAGDLNVDGGTPSLGLTETDASADNKTWSISAGSEAMLFRAFTDAGGGGGGYWAWQRDGNNMQELIGYRSGAITLELDNWNRELRFTGGTATVETTDAQSLIVGTNGTAAITIDSSQGVTLSDDLTVDTDTLHVDSTNDRVGIGTSSPSTDLHVQSAGASTQLEVENTDARPAQVRIITSNDNNRRLNGLTASGNTASAINLGEDKITFLGTTSQILATLNANVLDVEAALVWTPSSSETPSNNGEVTVEATNNTTLTFKLKGSDGTVRSGTITLA